MTNTSPPPEAQRFGRSQTPESPRPVHLPEPSTIPVLLNQMDPVFNDTETYNIPHNQTFSPYSESARAVIDSTSDEQDAVQNFLRGAEQENPRFDPVPNANREPAPTQNDSLFQTVANVAAYAENSTANANAAPSQDLASGLQHSPEPENPSSNLDVLQTITESISDSDSNVKSNPQDYTGIDYQSLLDTISQSASTAPAADSVSAPTTASAQEPATPVLPAVPGLPPKPPAQENGPENTFPTYSHNVNDSQAIQNLYQPPDAPHMPVFDTQQAPVPNYLGQAPGLNIAQASPTISTTGSGSFRPPEPARSTDLIERKMSPETQAKYDQFLEDERRYVTEGIWDKFPLGSRLFVGNLPSEKVTKRDLFFTFHKHGRLAQISIKQAYGFVQYLEASSCAAALASEQGVEIRGRKVHLEVSKPQKNSRNSNNQGNRRRRSRSPDRRARQNDRYGRASLDSYRDDRKRSEDYRAARSPSPRRYRSGDDYRPAAESPRFGVEARPRSPYGTIYPPPLPVAYDEEASLPLPRRDPRDVPDVQLLVLEPSIAQSFINWIEQGFRSRGLRASTIWLSSRLPLNGVVKRQIIEGVQAIVKLTQSAQYNSKIPLQVFDRTAAASNVNFNEYVDLDVPVAADIVSHARQKERGMAQTRDIPSQAYNQGSAQYGHQQPTPFPQQLSSSFPPQHQVPYQPFNQPGQYDSRTMPQSPVNMTPNSAGAPNLQQLLANLRQPGDGQKNLSPNDRSAPDLAGLLSNAVRHQSQGGQFILPPPPQQQAHYGGGAAFGVGPQQQPQQNVQNIMETLARYNR
ncbi:uncharacterized protein A1O9_00025 [Exophiala aquamarina CBS 119918]|uniref:RRM domain-containing protein n=1 Tax=Exophiala aquamarina CBS 119918 TaxID=1182545 RepID=A0A072PRT3_9EURO|nr:uncharacterized protein A1O9_00025 [Exophiala aquamarina CBS 119918]KEF62053.1 hypothetical protein A1O9_00025 [Exophiala aquamarina CBS 119918]